MHYVGIDVSKAKLDVLWLRDPTSGKVKTRVFENDMRAIKALVQWLQKQTRAAPEDILVTLEATGVYHENVAEALYEAGCQVLVANPARVKAYARSEGQMHKADKQDAAMLAWFGRDKGHRQPLWQPPAPEVRELRAMLRRLAALEKDLQREQNRLEKAAVEPISPRVKQSIQQMISALKEEIRQLRRDIDDHIDRHPRMKADRQRLLSIPGIADENAPHLMVAYYSRDFTSARAWSAFMGLVPRHEHSGTSVNKSPHIGHGGFLLLRKKLYMAAVTAKTHNPDVRALAQRLSARGKPGMSIVAAAMRKLIHIAYGVLKNQQEYRPQAA